MDLIAHEDPLMLHSVRTGRTRSWTVQMRCSARAGGLCTRPALLRPLRTRGASRAFIPFPRHNPESFRPDTLLPARLSAPQTVLPPPFSAADGHGTVLHHAAGVGHVRDAGVQPLCEHAARDRRANSRISFTGLPSVRFKAVFDVFIYSTLSNTKFWGDGAGGCGLGVHLIYTAHWIL